MFRRSRLGTLLCVIATMAPGCAQESFDKPVARIAADGLWGGLDCLLSVIEAE